MADRKPPNTGTLYGEGTINGREAYKSVVDDCSTCSEGGEFLKERCAKSKRPCGHHCNHAWESDGCDWCGSSWGEEGVEIKTSPEFDRRNDINRGLFYGDLDPEQVRLAKISQRLNTKFRTTRVLGAHPEGLDDV